MSSASHPMNFRRFLLGAGIGVFGIAAGFGLFALARFAATSDDDLKEKGVRGEAVVVDRWTADQDGARSPGSQLGGRDDTTCHFLLRYTPSGSDKPVEAEVTVLDGEYAKWNEAEQKFEDIAIGAKVPVLYLPEKPGRVETVHSIENAPGGMIGAILLIVFGVLVMGLGLFGAYLVLFVGAEPRKDAGAG